ncbi:NADH dehydrogenase 1 alpha subcomplex subunit 6 NDUFA6 [Phycomyces blakesleeanus]|uniref:LYR motif-containing protein 2 n=2 Tax=Phycomyces blakesleeanus TaxID=4837 RepID=A0A167KM48_PHYB8|nr:NADH dehydrogenase 1 alpha subcomplex subunit 6 NDUFA6 [Phycomyces blakesleeanus NRRL 1555(-)]OAD68409.1 NADH dehydrogenase 1 alpha subcomplex subunit 6 NDUFA6 [Phycomyces blakesleeanus NRRL 1555(-)]|eukprot:XP_018286449.1 NADH dehydrogenase 1 alpha subcomplex subunit 6 NDUFA6 [Phycomyces blakesleeanus NRRL 1555(-)]
MRPALILSHRAPPVPKFFKKESLTLDHFLTRGRVISLYRQILRSTKGLDKHDAQELRAWARSDFERARHETDLDKIKALLSSGKHQMHNLQSSITLAHAKK